MSAAVKDSTTHSNVLVIGASRGLGEAIVETYVRRGARVVGTVLSTDGSDLPWHRVLRTTGTPAPHIAVEQIRRLTAEGVLVVDARAAKGQRHAFGTGTPRAR